MLAFLSASTVAGFVLVLCLLLHYEAMNLLERISRELRPIINDVRVFSDKIARHPESLGVRGALDRRPGLK